MDRANTPAARPGNAPVTRLGGASGGGAGTPVAGHDRHPTRGGGWQLPPSPPTPHPPSRDASLQSPRKNGRPARTARRPRPPPTVRPWRYGQLHVATAPWQWGAPPRRRLVGHRGCHAPSVGRRSRRRHTAAAPPSGGDAGHASDCQTAVAPVAWSPTRPLTSARGGARLAAHALGHRGKAGRDSASWIACDWTRCRFNHIQRIGSLRCGPSRHAAIRPFFFFFFCWHRGLGRPRCGCAWVGYRRR